MKVGFLTNQIDVRGTTNALYDYALHNEDILGNASFIIVPDGAEKDRDMSFRISSRFGLIYPLSQAPSLNLDVLYHIKSGEDDGYRGIEGVKYAVHAVFNHGKHGDRYAMVSEWLGKQHNEQFVPHIVDLPTSIDNLRSRLNIPESDIVFGRHGGSDSFDIPWVWSAINSLLRARGDVWFLFMNTARPDIDFHDPTRVVFINPTVDPQLKKVFINTCDAMIHARSRGETFGIAVGEFAICDKAIFTYNDSYERAHIDELLDSGIPILYNSEIGLYLEFLQYVNYMYVQKYEGGYKRYTPENVMAKFKEVFLD